MIPFILAAVLRGMIVATALAASFQHSSAADSAGSVEQVLASVLRQSLGAPARVRLGEQATARLVGDLMIIPREPAEMLLTALGQPVAADLVGVLLGADGMRTAGIIRFVSAGFTDADAALAFTPDDLLSSLRNTVERGNAARLKEGLSEHKARRWVQAPVYRPESHQMTWAALILPKSAPHDSDGEITYRALAFGREGYLQVSVVTNVQGAEDTARMVGSFLGGLHFEPGKAYGDLQAGDRRAAAGLAGAMGLDSLDKAVAGSDLSPDLVVPITGGVVASIGGLTLAVYTQRHRRREARRG